jgi:ribosomal protein L3 glutamine methyltransferase
MQKSPHNTSMPADTIRSWANWGEQAFDNAGLYYGHGTDNPMDEAVYLIAYALKTDFDFTGFDIDKPLGQSDNAAIYALLKSRIVTRKPAAYLVNEAWFAGYPFYVNEHVLVPRSPLAELIAGQFYPWVDASKVKSIIDIGTGSGCIAIACALYLAHCTVDAVDIDEQALSLTQKNIQRHQLQDRVKMIKSDLFSQVPVKAYDIIISNPPYVSEAEYADLPVEYHREPKLGLTAGIDGLDCVRQMLRDAGKYLAEGGVLIVEVGNSQTALEDAFPEVPFTWLEFEHGGSGVFLLDKQQIDEYGSYFL